MRTGLWRALGAALTSAVVVGASALAAVADGKTWHDGWCEKGEGVTVVLDWANFPDAKPTTPGNQGDDLLVRCAVVSTTWQPGAAESDQHALLNRSGIPFDQSGGFITGANGLDGWASTFDDANPWYWHLSAGTVSGWGADDETGFVPRMGDDGYVDKFWGITYTDSKTADKVPRVAPQFSPTHTPPPSSTPSPAGGGSTGPATKPTGAGTSAASPRASHSPKVTASAQATTKPSVSNTPRPSPTPTVSPSGSPSPTPSTPASDAAAASASPSPVWGKETAAHAPAPTTASTPAPRWSSYATLGALGVILVGGLGFAAVALKPAKAPSLEDE